MAEVVRFRFKPQWPAEYPGIKRDKDGYIECRLFRPTGKRSYIEVQTVKGYTRMCAVPSEPLGELLEAR